MKKACDDLTTPRSVWVPCDSCDFHFLVNSLDERLPEGPFTCESCQGMTIVKISATQAQWVLLN